LIPNHYSAKLSSLDMQVVYSVPPGGNWKDIPVSIPSKRLEQIRASFARGEGSRSTYYGRLLPDRPSYTINTYFSRPGNGCHIHYSQDRVISQREAARFQSFPDSFIFYGSNNDISTQIGNAVPPLLAFVIAKKITSKLPSTGVFIDLFSGAGGLGLGFIWAGWRSILANDIKDTFLKTYSTNIDNKILLGSISDPNIFEALVNRSLYARQKNGNLPFWVLGGPPCQGFSTAGNRRTMDDSRNQLFLFYKKFLERVRPDGFVFENVAGLLNMDGGAIFDRVRQEFCRVMPNLTGWMLQAEDYGIPQRRKRVILVGSSNEYFRVDKPEKLTQEKEWVGAEAAIGDLPCLSPGEDGSEKEYSHDPLTHYQELMRGKISPQYYIEMLERNAIPQVGNQLSFDI